eukprot:CAMPEP_0175065188 /NCGR_PEP_ID=MMETSP0052_2-20121109/15775_1 /TAXON_ID=51329 ORGANISM="Polytomella parva, Strain SAG 63-3" /NCGR_SAMPLE_ID=MMETSP0052_2 /ASSEMBLY_ACC=CAM_ASM_000194 /LENGTH=109 /DNA_ID=CAMNT_0016331673 /DNA_START=51 /DNA_END=377 /DNA_ORIENTATION=-
MFQDSGGTSNQVSDAHTDSKGDSLEAFMLGLKDRKDSEKVNALREKEAEVELLLIRTERLLKIADPNGWLKPKQSGSEAAKLAMLQAAKALESDRQRRSAAAAAAAAAA